MQHLHLDVETRPAASLRERELEVGRLVLRAARAGDAFLLRRAAAAADGLEAGAARRSLRRAAGGVAEADGAAVRTGLSTWAGALEQHGLHEAAGEVYAVLRALNPGDAALTLHAARAARRSGRRDAALRLYEQAASECSCDAHMQLLVRIGEALVSDAPVAALTRVVGEARRMRDADAVAIAREERSRLVPATRAVRDLAAAAARYSHRTDRVRVLHRMAELLTGRGDLLGAREALLAALEHGSAAQQGQSAQRLRTVARCMGDELELRRSRGRGVAGPVMLVPPRREANVRSSAGRLRRWRSLLPVPAGC